MRRAAALLAFFMAAAPAVAATPQPPADVVQAAWQFYIDAWPQPQPGDDPADYPPPLPAAPDARTVRGWLKDGVLRPVKVTPFAQADWLIDTNRMQNVGNYWCGTGGCTVQIWAHYPTGHSVKIFDQQIREYHFRWLPRVAGEPARHTWMDADFHGSLCGLAGVEACPWGFEWRSDGRAHFGLFATWRFAEGRFAEGRFARGEVLHPGPPPQAVDPMVDPENAGVPQVILDIVARNDAACKAWGADNFGTDGMVNRLPDLNGDGIDDWSYDGPGAACNFDEPNPDLEDVSDAPQHEHVNDNPCAVVVCETRIWLSRRDGPDVAWDRAPLADDHAYALRHRGGRTDLVQLDDPPGLSGPDDPAACDTYSIGNCVLTPVSLANYMSPKP